MNNQQANNENPGAQLLKQYLTDEAQQSREQDDKALEDLLNTNAQLNDQIDELKKKFKDYVEPLVHDRILEQLKEHEHKSQLIHEENRDLQKKSEAVQKERDAQNQELQKIKLEKQRAQSDLNKTK